MLAALFFQSLKSTRYAPRVDKPLGERSEMTTWPPGIGSILIIALGAAILKREKK